MALTGTLEDVPLDELSSLLQQQRRTGTLKLTLPRGEVQILFRDGMICQVDDTRRPASLHIGELLVEGGLIDRAELATALEDQRNSNKPLGAILVGMGLVQITDLANRLELQFRESLYPLYQMTSGHFEFDPSISTPRILAPPPIPVEDVTMEAVRRIDELPQIETILPSPIPPFLRPPDKTELPTEGTLAEKLGPRDRAIFGALARGGTVEQLVGQTGLSSFDVKKGLALLFRTGYAVPVRTGGTPGAATRGVNAIATGLLGPKRRGVRVVFQALFTLLLTASLLALGLRLTSDRTPLPSESLHHFDTPFSAFRQFLIENHLLRLETAVELYRLEQGSYPSDLMALIEAGLIEPPTLSFPGLERDYYYRRSGEGYLLLPPKQ